MDSIEVVILDQIDGMAWCDAMERLRAPSMFDPAFERYIEGCCSNASVNANGVSYNPGGGLWSLPLPLLVEHNYKVAVGLVDVIQLVGDRLKFKARVANGSMQANEAWDAITNREALGVSLGYGWLEPPTMLLRGDALCPHYKRWCVSELSICRRPANVNAVIDLAATFKMPRGVFVLDKHASRYRTLHIDDRRIVRTQLSQMEATR